MPLLVVSIAKFALPDAMDMILNWSELFESLTMGFSII